MTESFHTWTNKVNVGEESETAIALLQQRCPWARSLLPDWGFIWQLPGGNVCNYVRVEHSWKSITLWSYPGQIKVKKTLTRVADWQTDLCDNFLPYPSTKCCLSPLVSAGPPSRDNPLLLRPADWWRLRGSAGGGLPLGDSSARAGARCILSPGPTPSAGSVLHPLQPGCVQEPASHTAPWPGHWLLWQPRWSQQQREGKSLGVRDKREGWRRPVD